MGSVVSTPVDVQNALEEKMRKIAFQKQEIRNEMGDSDATKDYDFDRRMLGPLSKYVKKRATYDSFDAIITECKPDREETIQNGLVFLLCDDAQRKVEIKKSLQKLFSHQACARWPDFKIRRDESSIVSSVKEYMQCKVIGFTDFFILYAVVSERLENGINLEADIAETVEYFANRHQGALKGVQKIFIFECPKSQQDLPYERFSSVFDDVTVVVTDMQDYHKVLGDIANGRDDVMKMIEISRQVVLQSNNRFIIAKDI